MVKRSSFTLLELLTVITIIIILAGILIPTVAVSRERGRITQAKADIASLLTALKSLDSDYGKMLKQDGSNYKIGNVSATKKKITETVDADTTKDKYTRCALDSDASYNALIAELSAPKNSGLTVSVNKRKKTYLEPKKGFVPGTSYTSQSDVLWRDPWGKCYRVFINVDKTDELEISSALTVPANVAIYSSGPNGTDDGGCNVDRDRCISSGNHKNHDDVASWDF